MAGKGELESITILALVQTFTDQYLAQTPHISQVGKMVDNIRTELNHAWHHWKGPVSLREMAMVERKLEALSNTIPMDREIDIVQMTSFLLSTLEDFSKKLKPHKRMSINRLILAVLELHEYYADPNNNDFDYLMDGSKAADAWEMEAIQ